MPIQSAGRPDSVRVRARARTFSPRSSLSSTHPSSRQRARPLAVPAQTVPGAPSSSAPTGPAGMPEPGAYRFQTPFRRRRRPPSSRPNQRLPSLPASSDQHRTGEVSPGTSTFCQLRPL